MLRISRSRTFHVKAMTARPVRNVFRIFAILFVILAHLGGPILEAHPEMAHAAGPVVYTFTTQGCTVWTVPPGISSVHIQAIGAAGSASNEGVGIGGLGDGFAATLSGLTPGSSLYVCVDFRGFGSGGGASGVSLGSDFSRPVLVAGGGGSAGSYGGGIYVANGGNAGYPRGQNGSSGFAGTAAGGGGGTANSGGVGGDGGGFDSGTDGSGSTAAGPGVGGAGGGAGYGGGGGGGYFGGGGGGGLPVVGGVGGGGGGSSGSSGGGVG